MNNEDHFSIQKSHSTKALLPFGQFLVYSKQSFYFNSWSTHCHATWSQEERIMLPSGIFWKCSKATNAALPWNGKHPHIRGTPCGKKPGASAQCYVSTYGNHTCNVGGLDWWGWEQHHRHVSGGIEELQLLIVYNEWHWLSVAFTLPCAWLLPLHVQWSREWGN